MLAGATPNFATTPRSSRTSFRLRSHCTTRSPTTHCARSLSGVQMKTRSTRGSRRARAAPDASPSSASSSFIAHTGTPIAASASSNG